MNAIAIEQQFLNYSRFNMLIFMKKSYKNFVEIV